MSCAVTNESLVELYTYIALEEQPLDRNDNDVFPMDHYLL